MTAFSPGTMFYTIYGSLLTCFLLNVVFMQTYDKARNAVALALSPVVKALVDPDGALKDIRNLDSVRYLLILFLGFHSLL